MANEADHTGIPAPAADRRPLIERAAAAHRAGDRQTALRLYTALLSRQPRHAIAWTNLGALFRAEARHELALAAQRRAHALNPDAMTVRANLANILDDTGAHAEAAGLRRGLLAEHPEDADQAALLVRSLRGCSDLAVALDAGLATHARFPDSAQAELQLALTQLVSGDYAAGFRSYGARWRTGELQPPDNPLPRWAGTALNGQRLLVIHEQGFGDTLNFARFVPDLARFGGKVSMLSRPPTARLLHGLPGTGQVIAGQAPAREFDTWAPIMDLAEFHFRDDLPLPPPAPLHLPDDAQARAKALLQPFSDDFRVGVTWTGSVTNDRNTMRSFSHTRLLPLAEVPGARLLSLYKGPQLAAYQGDGTAAFIPDLAGTDRDLADCAAVIAGLDLVITADTVTAHIAGSLGVEVWVLLHWDGFWLWGTDPSRTPWYPSMRLIRQDTPGDWDTVFARVETTLRDRVAHRQAG